MSVETNLMSIAGDLTIAASAALRESLADRLIRGEDVVLDLSGVDCCDASGLQLLWSLRKSADERNVRVRLSAISPAVREAAAALGLRLGELAQEDAGAVSKL
jgi:anti-sigma B factor antagonist